jgi:hypothetical protein
MRKDEFERRAAEMRTRFTATPVRTPPVREATDLRVPELPAAPPHSLLHGIWKPSHTKALLAALGDVHPIVIRTARGIGTQQVGFDGLVYVSGKGMLDIAASTRAFPEALRSFDRLLRVSAERGCTVDASGQTMLTVQGEAFRVRIRETSERRLKPAGSSSFRDSEYFPTGQLWLRGSHEQGSDIRASVGDTGRFLDRLRRLADRLPRLRQQRRERERAREEEWDRKRAVWQREEDARRQRTEQQERFNQVTGDVEQWLKAEHIRAYATAFEAHHVEIHGAIESGGPVDGWLRWIHWYAHHLDPITRPSGPPQAPT